jgi:sugar phosphate isomerase/epimerase
MPRLALASGTIANHPLRERLAAAAAAGFVAIGMRNLDYERACATDADVRAMLSCHGLVVSDLQPLMEWGFGGDAGRRSRDDEETAYRVAAAIGGEHLIATGLDPDDPFDVVVERFAALCDRAARQGLRVGLEFLPWTAIGSPGAAWSIVRAADRPNAGLVVDPWHIYRGGLDETSLLGLPGDRVVAVHLDDGGSPSGDPVEDTRRRRLLPGEGIFPLAAFLRTVYDLGTDALCTVEILSEQLDARPARAAAEACAQASRRVLRQTDCQQSCQLDT